MQSLSQRQQLRLKIKKLKYKIEKQEKLQSQYRLLLNRIKKFNDEKLTIQRVLKKVSFLLEIKGLTLTDWFCAFDYDEQFQIETLVKVLQNIGVKLHRQQKGILINHLGDQFSQNPTVQEFQKIMSEFGLMLD